MPGNVLMGDLSKIATYLYLHDYNHPLRTKIYSYIDEGYHPKKTIEFDDPELQKYLLIIQKHYNNDQNRSKRRSRKNRSR